MAESNRAPRAAKSDHRVNRVFVDFENVPTVDLALIGGKVAEVTLLIGEKQRRIDLSLVQQILEHADKVKVTLVEVGVSGRNALDLVLAWHLGKTAERHPDDPFFVVSKDKDFDPLIVHLQARGLTVARVGAFSALPFLSPAPKVKKPALPRPSAGATTASNKPLETVPLVPVDLDAIADDQLSKVAVRLQHKTKARPARRKTLLSYINGFYRNQLTDTELDSHIATLGKRGIFSIDPTGRVTYPEADPAKTH